jgi:hypothetical protein
MLLALCFIFLAILFALPFFPGICEFYNAQDSSPLYIDMNYSKDPRYFAVSFRKKLMDSLAEHTMDGVHEFQLSKHETIEIMDHTTLANGNSLKNICYVRKDIHSENNVVFEKEVYAHGGAKLGENNILRGLACDGNIHALSGTRFVRWLDANGCIRTETGCNLGISASCLGTLSLAPKCVFKRLYGFPIITCDSYVNIPPFGGEPAVFEAAVAAFQQDNPETNEPVVTVSETIERNATHIPPNSQKECTIITPHCLTIGEYSVISGHIKTNGKFTTGNNVIIAGNLFADGDIHLGPNCRVIGTIFTQGHITLDEGVIVGSKGQTKSVIGKKGITIRCPVMVYGYIMTEGTGIVG